MGVISRAAAGALAGSIATLPMTAVMVAVRSAASQDGSEIAPYEVVSNIRRRAGLESHTHRLQVPATLAAHFAFGAAVGAFYALMRGETPRRVSPAGVLYGLLVWAVSYLGWLPVLRLFPPPYRDSPIRTGRLILAHVIWGACLEAATWWLRASSRHTRTSDSPE